MKSWRFAVPCALLWVPLAACSEGGRSAGLDASGEPESGRDAQLERDAAHPDGLDAGGLDGASAQTDAEQRYDAAVNAPDAGDAQVQAAEAGQKDAGGPPSGERVFPTDRGAFGLGGASRCAGASLLLCEDFEGEAIDTSVWELQTWGAGSASIDDSRAARGKHALHITQPATSARVVLRETLTFPAASNHFFGRVFLYLNYMPDALACNDKHECPNLVHWTAVAASGDYESGGKTYRPDVRAVGAVNQKLLTNLDGAPKAEVGLDDNNPPAGYEALDASRKEQWMCFEFEYSGVGADAEIRVWWDGREHPSLHYSTAQRGSSGELWSIPVYDALDFGFTHYQDYSAYVSQFDAWLDEIAVDDERIGCAL